VKHKSASAPRAWRTTNRNVPGPDPRLAKPLFESGYSFAASGDEGFGVAREYTTRCGNGISMPSRSKAALILFLSSRAVSHCLSGRVLVTMRKVTWESPKFSTPKTCGGSRIPGPKSVSSCPARFKMETTRRLLTTFNVHEATKNHKLICDNQTSIQSLVAAEDSYRALTLLELQPLCARLTLKTCYHRGPALFGGFQRLKLLGTVREPATWNRAIGTAERNKHGAQDDSGTT
jgi:hypothetical protein